MIIIYHLGSNGIMSYKEICLNAVLENYLPNCAY